MSIITNTAGYCWYRLPRKFPMCGRTLIFKRKNRICNIHSRIKRPIFSWFFLYFFRRLAEVDQRRYQSELVAFRRSLRPVDASREVKFSNQFTILVADLLVYFSSLGLSYSLVFFFQYVSILRFQQFESFISPSNPPKFSKPSQMNLQILLWRQNRWEICPKSPKF